METGRGPRGPTGVSGLRRRLLVPTGAGVGAATPAGLHELKAESRRARPGDSVGGKQKPDLDSDSSSKGWIAGPF